jgi:hypothetical protein
MRKEAGGSALASSVHTVRVAQETKPGNSGGARATLAKGTTLRKQLETNALRRDASKSKHYNP